MVHLKKPSIVQVKIVGIRPRANERREVLGELRQNCRQFRLEWVSALDPAAVVERGIFDTRADESGIARSISRLR